MRKNLGVIGEALVDVVMSDTAETRSHPGGSPLNVAVGLARLGESVLFAGRYGRDDHGQLIAEHLRANNVVPLLEPDDRPTSVARAILDPTGAASYEFDLHWELTEEELVTGLAADELLHVHVGSIGTALEPGATTVVEAVKRLEPTATVSYDPNCRPSILPNRAAYRARAEELVALSDVVHASDEDLEWLYPERTLSESLHAWQDLGPGLVMLTRGAKAILGVTAAGEVEEPIVPTEIADTVGAGDSFTSALLVALKDRELLGVGNREALAALTVQQARDVIRYAAQASAITSSRPGAEPPTRDELTAALSETHG